MNTHRNAAQSGPAGDPATQRPAGGRLSGGRLAGRSLADRVQTVREKQPLLMLSAFLFLCLVLLAPIMSFGDVMGMGGTSAGFTGEGSIQRQAAYVLLAVAALVAVIREGRGLVSLIPPWPIMLAVIWCWISLMWAINPGVGLRRLLLTTLVIWTSFVIVQNAGYLKSLKLLRIAFVLALLGNYLTVLVNPAVGIHTMVESAAPTAVSGNWRGFLGHKNFAGAACAVLILLFTFDARAIRPAIRVAVILAAGFFLFKTQSKTSAGMVAGALLTGYMFQKLEHRKRLFAMPILMFLTAGGWFLYSAYGDFVIDNYLTPASFTGRGHIWNSLLRYANDNLMTGAGFGSFWNVGAASPVYKYGQGYITEITVGHNGYIDLLITIGLPGLLLALFATIIWPAWRLLTFRIDPRRGALISALLLFCMGHNITESSLFERDALVGVILMFCIAFARQWGEETIGETRRATGADVFEALRHRTPATGRT